MCIRDSTVTEHEKMARVLVDQMKEIGIELIPDPMDKALQTDKLYNTHESVSYTHLDVYKRQTLNPLVGNDMAGSWILNLIYPTLMVLDENGIKQPYIIEEPEISEDGLTVTVTLKDGFKWQDGTPLSSDDLIYTCLLYTSY